LGIESEYFCDDSCYESSAVFAWVANEFYGDINFDLRRVADGGIVPYPNIRFGFMQPGDNMVARRVWWRVPVLYQTALQTIEAQTAGTTVTRYPGMVANYVLSIYEIPSQLPITGNANIQLGLNPDGSGWGNTSSRSSFRLNRAA